MLIQNRVFFRSIAEAEQHGYRACKHCMTPSPWSYFKK
jgi:methylphosphotriester-DNA--protein-cysteine methyltransferase